MKKTYEVNTSSKELIIGLNRLMRECNTPTGSIDKGIRDLIRAYGYDETTYIMEWYNGAIDKTFKDLGYNFKEATDIKRKLIKLYKNIVDDEVADLKNIAQKRKANFINARILLYDFDKLSRPFCNYQIYPRTMELSIQWMILIYEKRFDTKERIGSEVFFTELRDMLSYYNCIYFEDDEKREARKNRSAENDGKKKTARDATDTATSESEAQSPSSEYSETEDLDAEEF